MKKRMIDANALKRHIIAFATGFHATYLTVDNIVRLINQAETVDAMEVVRCRECIHFGLYDCPMCYIEKQELIFINYDPDFYCGRGERKEDG